VRNTRRLVVAFTLALAVAAQGGSSPELTLDHFERLSFDLRGHRLRPAEREAIESSMGNGSAESTYSRLVDEWLDKDAIKGYLDTFLQFAPTSVADPTAETFFHRLSRRSVGATAVYYLPHTVTSGSLDSPCPTDERALVTVWWQEEPITVCRESYRPQVLFDEVGYCSGEAEPLMRQPPRPGCGCGPVMMGCLPPLGDVPRLDALVTSTVRDE